MPFSSGAFSRLYDWTNERDLGNDIDSTKMDAEDDGFATGLSNTICRDGQSTITANIPFNSMRITGLGDATAATDALNRQTADARYVQTDAEVTALQSVTSAADKLFYFTGSGTGAVTDFTATARTLLDDSSTSAMRTTLGLAIGTDVQAYDADLAAVAGLSSTGLIARTGSGTASARTITGTSNQITVTNGDGVSGNPTLSLPSDVIVPTVLTVPNSGLHILDTNASHDLIITPGSNLTADRTLTVTTGDADRTLDISAASVTVSSFAATVLDDTSASSARSTLDTEQLGVVRAVNAQGGTSYTLVLTDAGKLVNMSNGSGNTVTVPPNSSVAFATGTWIRISQGDVGATTLVEGSGVEVGVYGDNLQLAGPFAGCIIVKVGTDNWLAFGEFAP
jgi:hypothetical protein